MKKFPLASGLAACAVLPFLLGASAPNASGTSTRVYVRHHSGMEATKDSVFEWPAVDAKVYSSKFFNCTVSSSMDAVRSITLDCRGPQNYRAQTTAQCAINQSRETAAYLFVAKVGTAGANRNFYVWCAP